MQILERDFIARPLIPREQRGQLESRHVEVELAHVVRKRYRAVRHMMVPLQFTTVVLFLIKIFDFRNEILQFEW